MSSFSARFNIGDRVAIDGDSQHVGVVVQVSFKGASHSPSVEYDVRTWRDGAEQQTWIDEFRLGRPL